MTRIGLLVLLLLLSPRAHAGERLAAIAQDLHAHGLVSSTVAVQRMQAAEDRPAADAPLSQRQLYYDLVADYASRSKKPELVALAKDAIGKLEAMAAQEHCVPCARQALLAQAQLALTRRDPEAVSKLLGRIATGLGQADAPMQLRYHRLRAGQYRVQGLYPRGVAEILPTIDLATRLGYTAELADAMNMQLMFNAYLGDHARAEAVARDAMALAERIGYRRAMADIQLNLGFAYSGADQLALQLRAYQRGLEVAGDDPALAATRIILLSNLSDYWLRARDYRKALDYAQQAATLAASEGDALGGAFAATNAGVAKAHLGQLDAGIADVQGAIDVSRKVGTLNDVIGTTQELAGIYELAGRYREAYATLKSITALQEELAQQMRDRAVLELQEKYSAQTRQREIERLADANRVKAAQLAAQASQRTMWIVLALALLLAAVLLVQWLARVRQANRRLSDDVAVLAEQSSHDALTGAFNRRQGHALLRQHTQAAQAAAPAAMPTLGVMLLDIDFFKRVNDTHGHAAGDRVLVEVAKRLQELLRAHDAVVRWGGEEFLLLLPNARADALPMLAGRVLQAIACTPVPIDGQAITVSVSAGCLLSPFGGITDIEALVQVADLALYRAKASGRNQAMLVTARGALDIAVLGQDLLAASHAGHVRLEVVHGPTIERQFGIPADGIPEVVGG